MLERASAISGRARELGWPAQRVQVIDQDQGRSGASAAGRDGFQHLVAQVGSSQIMLGTDHPIPWNQQPVDHIFATTTLSDDEKVAILGGNAAKLLGIKA